MTLALSWPTTPVTCGPVVLREFSAADLPMVQEMSTDPCVPLIGTLPPNATGRQAQAYMDRQLGRLPEAPPSPSPSPRRATALLRARADTGWRRRR